MKKTLIALAAVAVSSAAMAQVTISGNLTYGYTSTYAAATQTSDGGLGFDGSSLSFSAAEDLGNGLKLSASAGFENLADNNAVVGTGASIAISGDFGKITMSSSASSDYLPIDNITTVANGTTHDRINYTSPSMGGLTVSLTHGDGEQNIGARLDSSASNSVGVTYAAGPLSINGTYVKFLENATTETRHLGKVSYDLGAAKITYGMLRANMDTSANNVTENGLSVSVPMGAITLGADMVSSKTGAAAKLKGTKVSASYALSKRTSVDVFSKSWDVANQPTKSKETSVLLSHSF